VLPPAVLAVALREFYLYVSRGWHRSVSLPNARSRAAGNLWPCGVTERDLQATIVRATCRRPSN